MLQTTMTLCAAAAAINIWIFIRIVTVRGKLKVMHGDGGSPLLAHRIRAHANFIENTPLVLLLIGTIEYTGKGGQWLAIVGAVFMLGRVAHVIGMDKEQANLPRMIGATSALLIQAGLAVVAVLMALGRF